MDRSGEEWRNRSGGIHFDAAWEENMKSIKQFALGTAVALGVGLSGAMTTAVQGQPFCAGSAGERAAVSLLVCS